MHSNAYPSKYGRSWPQRKEDDNATMTGKQQQMCDVTPTDYYTVNDAFSVNRKCVLPLKQYKLFMFLFVDRRKNVEQTASSIQQHIRDVPVHVFIRLQTHLATADDEILFV